MQSGAHPTLVIPAKHGHVNIALVPPGTAGDAHAAFWELAAVPDAEVPAVMETGMIQVVDAAGTLRTFRKAAQLFHDHNTIFLNSGSSRSGTSSISAARPTRCTST